MRIGELSKRTGISVQAIRLYERRRLLKAPPRTPAGYRVYSEDYVDMVRLIHQGKQFGFTLNEIRKILGLFAVPDSMTGRTRYQPGEHACVVEILRIGTKKLEDLETQITSLRRKRKELKVALNQLATPAKHGRKTTAATAGWLNDASPLIFDLLFSKKIILTFYLGTDFRLFLSFR